MLSQAGVKPFRSFAARAGKRRVGHPGSSYWDTGYAKSDPRRHVTRRTTDGAPYSDTAGGRASPASDLRRRGAQRTAGSLNRSTCEEHG